MAQWRRAGGAALQRTPCLSSRAASVVDTTSLPPVDRTGYEERGYWTPAGFSLSPARLAGLQAALARVLAANPDAAPDSGLINAHLRTGERGAKICGDPFFLELGRDPVLTGLLAALHSWDDGVILWACQVFCKQGRTGRRVPFHCDGV
jgi:hypothetical protein